MRRARALCLGVSLAVHGGLLAALLEEGPEQGAQARGAGGFRVALATSGAAAGSEATSPAGAPLADPVPPREIAHAAEPAEPVETVRAPEAFVAPDTPPPPPAPSSEGPPLVATRDAAAEPAVAAAGPAPVKPPPPEAPAAMPEPVEAREPEPVATRAAEAVTTAAVEEARSPRPAALPPPARRPRRPHRETAPEAETTPVREAPPTESSTAETGPPPGAKARAGSGGGSEAGEREKSAEGGGRPGVPPDYLRRLQAWLERHKAYPGRARRMRQQGTTLLRFAIDGEGRVLDHTVVESSGHPALDKAAARMLARARPLPRPPAGLVRTRLELTVPVRFVLR